MSQGDPVLIAIAVTVFLIVVAGGIAARLLRRTRQHSYANVVHRFRQDRDWGSGTATSGSCLDDDRAPPHSHAFDNHSHRGSDWGDSGSSDTGGGGDGGGGD